MGHERNIWVTSLKVLVDNYIFMITYCAALIIVWFLQEYFQSKSAQNVGIVIASAVLAIPAHLSILSNLKSSEAMMELQRKSPTYMSTFVFRTIALGVISIVPSLIMISIFGSNWGEITVFLAVFLSILLLSALVFAKWGTMLPAIVMQDDKTFAAAGKRGKVSFTYAFPRLLVSFVLIGIIQIVVTMISVMTFKPGENFFPEAGGFYFALLFSCLIGATIGGYQIIMTSVILSRAYLRAENDVNSSGLVSA